MQPALDRIRHNPTLSRETKPAARELSASQIEVLGALATGASIAESARRAGVHRSTVHDWINRNNLFVAQVNQLKCERLDSVRTQMHSLSSAALDALRDILTSSKTPASTRLQAALALLDSLGALESNPIGPTDPHAVSDARRLQQMREEFPRLF
jgi:hypothetical protein